MKLFKADFHIHTVLSPCGSLEMSPSKIIDSANEQGLDIIGITDHNTTLQCKEVVKVGEKKGIKVLCGAEVSTREEVHCLTFFENFEKLEAFQEYLDAHLPNVTFDVDHFGHQVWVNELEEILGQEERLLISAIDQSIEEVEQKVKSLGGLFIPAHVDKARNSLYSQLGFMPFDLQPDAMGMSPNANINEQLGKHPELKKYQLVRSSDAHQPDLIGSHYTILKMKAATFDELKQALHSQNGRKVINIV